LRRFAKAATVLLGASLLAAACGGDNKDSSSTTAAAPATTSASGATTAAGGAATTASGGAATTASGATGGKVSLAVEQEPTSFNYNTSTDNAAWTQYIMQFVWPWATSQDPKGTFVTNKDLLTADPVITTKDPQTVVYKLNPKATWSDGTPITVDDFIYTWKVQSGVAPYTPEATDAASQNGYEDISDVKGSADGTITVTFATPYADWIALFGPILPEHAFKAEGGGDDIKGFKDGFKTASPPNLANVVSGGPYVVSDYKPGQGMTLTRNEKYWGTPGTLDEIDLPFITDANQEPQALKNGEVDVIFPQAQLDLVSQVKGIEDVSSIVGFGTFWEHLDLNFSNPALGELPVRQAFAQALDRADIVAKLPAQFDPRAVVLNNRMYFPGNANYKDNAGTYAKTDTTKADKLLTDAGYAKGADGIYAKGDQKLSFKLVWRQPNARRDQTAQLIQAQMKAFGIDIQLAPAPDFTFLDAGAFDIALFGWTGVASQAANTSIYVPDGGQNYTKNADPKIRELFDQANVELDESKRADLMNQIDQQVWADMATIPLFQVPEFLAWNKKVGGPEYNGYQGPAWNSPLWTVS